MQDTEPVSLKNSVVTKLLRYVFLIYLLVAFVVTVFQMVSEYRRAEDNVIQDLKNFYVTLNPTLSIALWEADSDQMQSILQGVIKNPAISGLKINDLSENYVRRVGKNILVNDELKSHEKGSSGIRIDSKGNDLFGYQFPINYSGPDTTHEIGRVTLYSSAFVIFERVQYSYLFIIVSAIIKTLVLWIVFLFFSRFLLQRPLAELTSTCKEIELDNLENIRVNLNASGKDELSILAEALNNMVQKLLNSRILLKNYNQRLEQEVSERTLEVQSSQAELQALFSGMTDAVFMLDNEGRYLKIAPTSIGIHFKPKKEMIGKTLHDLFPRAEADFFLDRIHQCLKSQQNISMEYALDIKGQEIWFDGRISPMSETVIVLVVRDITERKQVEREKIKAQKIASEHKKLALVGQIAGKMAHDFNNVLGIVMGNTELALKKCNDEKLKKRLELILEQTIRGKNLTKNLVAFAKDQEPRHEYFRITEKIDLVLKLLQRELDGIKVVREYNPAVPDLLADSGMIEHALVNLIQNSIHATSKSEHPKITIRAYSRNEAICIEIEDNGCGIPEDALERIYDPAFTLKGSKDVIGSYEAGIRGTGYGMANVKKYIEQHKGTMSVQSKVDSGTVFSIHLPVFKKELTSEEKTTIKNEITQYEKCILLVEDETAISDVQYRVLTEEPCNHKVDIAHNGRTAMDLFDRNHYDFVSLDYILPGDTNGMDVYHHIRKSEKRTPILFVSGNLQFLESIQQLKQKDLYIDHISKPCQNKDYVQGINKLMEQTNQQ
ncbi:MAG: response regulator [Desulfobacter sp.]|nr:MAG: response regulator [Desulfobacter sp.]